jgi:hypothetical protein
MNSQQEKVMQLFEKDNRMSPAFLMHKLKITSELATDLCHWAWRQRARDAFYMRAWGMNEEEYMRGDHLDG